METVSTTKLTDWFALQIGDWVTSESNEQVGVVRAIDGYATYIELNDGHYTVPHSRAQVAKHYFSHQII